MSKKLTQDELVKMATDLGFEGQRKINPDQSISITLSGDPNELVAAMAVNGVLVEYGNGEADLIIDPADQESI
jgi:hypothetical protein